MHYAALIPELLSLAARAGRAIMEVHDSNNLAIEVKDDDSPVTRADKASNLVLTEGLARLTPEIPIISEENVEIPYAERAQFDHFWLIDPLDGTKEFIKRNGEFTINIALVAGKSPVLGVVYRPSTEGVYFAVRGEGAFFQKNGETVRIACAAFRLSDERLRIPISRSHLNDGTQTLLKAYRNPILQPVGSALKFLLIAEGVLDIYPRIGTTMEWDTAAPQIILEEAGGQLLQLDTRQPLVYNKESLKNPDFIAFGTVLD